MIYFKKNIIFNFLLALIIPLLITGGLFPDLFVSVSSLIFLFYVFKKKNFYYFNKKPLIIFFIFCLYCIFVSLVKAENILLSLESSLFYFRIGLFACLIWYLIEKNKNILQHFYYSLIICFSALTVDSYFQYFTGSNIFGFIAQNNRVTSFFNNEQIMGSYLSRLFPLLFALFLVKEKKKKYEIYFIGLLFILVDVLIYISGERTSFFFLNLSTIFIIILTKKYQKFRLITFLISFSIILFFTLTNDKIFNRMIKEPYQSFGFENDTQKKNIFTPAHDSLIQTAFAMFLDKPILGHGPKMFRVMCKKEKYQTGLVPCSTHPHNFYIQLLAETGIIGFFFLLSAFVYILYCACRQLRAIVLKQKQYLSDYQICLLAGMLITVWPFSPNGNFFNNWLAICYSLPVGFYLQTVYKKNKINSY
jgi:O-antigen ligase